MQAHFTQGSIYKHIIKMSVLSAIGLLSIFIVDLVDLYFLSLLGEIQMASAIGFAGIILFFTIAISIGFMIAMGAMVAQSIGAKDLEGARAYTTNVFVLCLIIGSLVGFGVWFFVPEILAFLGAKGRSLILASSYLAIIVPSLPVLMVAMAAAGALRSVGDAKHAMYVTLLAGIINAVLDPLLIFTFDMGIAGAAWASVAARVGMMIYALYLVVYKHKLLGIFDIERFKKDLPVIAHVALPAVLTNIETPVGNAYVMYVLADFGDSAVAGFSIIGRIIPVAFCLVFAISGAVGPIIGQNHGAKLYERVHQVIRKSFVIIVVYSAVISLLLFALKGTIVSVFNAQGEASYLIVMFCTWLAILSVFRGFLFVANAAFNNLGKAQYSTAMNFGKATLGTVPFVYYGAKYYGAFGILLFETIGSIVFGIMASFVAFRTVKQLKKAHP